MRLLFIVLVIILLIGISHGYKLVDKRIYYEKITGLYKFKDYLFVLKENRYIDVYKLGYNYLEKMYTIKGRSKIDSMIGFESYRDYLILSDKDYLLFVRLYSIKKDTFLYKYWEKSPPETLYVATYSKNYRDADILLLADFGENKRYNYLVVIINDYKTSSSKIFTLKLGDGYFVDVWNKSFKGIARCATIFDYNEDSFDNYLAICLGNNILILDKAGDIVYKVSLSVDKIYPADFDEDNFYDDLVAISGKYLYKLENENGIIKVDRASYLNSDIKGIFGVYDGNKLKYYIIYTKNYIYEISKKLSVIGKFYIDKPLDFVLNVDSDKDGMDDDLVIVSNGTLFLFRKRYVEIPELVLRYKIYSENGTIEIKYFLKNVRNATAYNVKLEFGFNSKYHVDEFDKIYGRDVKLGDRVFNGSEGLLSIRLRYQDENGINYEKYFEEKIEKILDLNLISKDKTLMIKIVKKKDININSLLKIYLNGLRFNDDSNFKTFKVGNFKDYYLYRFNLKGSYGEVHVILEYSYGNVTFKEHRYEKINIGGEVLREKKVNITVHKYVERKKVSYGEELPIYINIVTNISGVKGFVKVKIIDTLPKGFRYLKGNGSYTLMLLPKDNYTYRYVVKVKSKIFSLGERVKLPRAKVIYNGHEFYSNEVEIYIKPKVFPLLIALLPIFVAAYLIIRKRRIRSKERLVKKMIELYKRKGIKPNIKEIARRLNMEEDEVKKILRRMKR